MKILYNTDASGKSDEDFVVYKTGGSQQRLQRMQQTGLQHSPKQLK